MSSYNIKGEIAEATLTNHHEPFIVDANMVDRVRKCRSWNALFNKNGEVRSIQGCVPGVGMVVLARWLMQDELATTEIEKPMVDHINRRPLINLKSNLRIVTRNTNSRSRHVTGKTSKYPGVSWIERDKRWKAQINIDGKRKHIGYFTSELDAARAYRAKYKMLDPISEYEVWLELDKPEPVKQTTLNQFFAERWSVTRESRMV